mgnify:CR=1 FL=1
MLESLDALQSRRLWWCPEFGASLFLQSMAVPTSGCDQSLLWVSDTKLLWCGLCAPMPCAQWGQ